MRRVFIADGAQGAHGSNVDVLLYVFHFAQSAPVAAGELEGGMGFVALAGYLDGQLIHRCAHRTHGERRGPRMRDAPL